MENKEKKMNTELGNKLDDISVAYSCPFDKSEHTFHVICTSDSNTGSILTRQTCADLSTSSMPFLFICYTRYVNIYTNIKYDIRHHRSYMIKNNTSCFEH